MESKPGTVLVEHRIVHHIFGGELYVDCPEIRWIWTDIGQRAWRRARVARVVVFCADRAVGACWTNAVHHV
eukprot:9072777-Pyramimonas_sp.AAC.1